MSKEEPVHGRPLVRHGHKALRALELIHLWEWLRTGGLLHEAGVIVSSGVLVWGLVRGNYFVAALAVALVIVLTAVITRRLTNAKRDAAEAARRAAEEALPAEEAASREAAPQPAQAQQQKPPTVVLLKCIKSTADARHGAGQRFGVAPYEVAKYLETGCFIVLDRESAFADLVDAITDARRSIRRFADQPPDRGLYYPHGDAQRNDWLAVLNVLKETAKTAAIFDSDAADYGILHATSDELREEADGHGRLEAYKVLSERLGDWLADRLGRRGRGL